MSSLWTPGGEHRVPRPGDAPPPSSPPPPPAPPGGDGTPAGAGEEVARLQAALLEAPVEVVVANHAYGLFELAALHLSQRPPGLAQAKLAIDALAALVEGLQGRMGEDEGELRDGLATLRLGYVQVSQAAAAEAGG